MRDQTKIIHTLSDFNRGLHTRRYIKPTICSRDFLTGIALDMKSEKEWGYHLAKATGMDVSTIVEINLEFLNIQSTYGLGYLRSCQILKANNNIISRIVGLDNLTELRSLDLSFNNIDKIEGLHKCTKLEEVMLFHNTIVKLEGLEPLEKLTLLNVGCNQIGDLVETYGCLRRLTSLRTVNLERNPLTKVNHYREHMVVYVPHLQILDWKRVLPVFKAQAFDLLRDDYRTYVAKERLDEKRKKLKTLNAEAKNTKYVFPIENSLFKTLNAPSDEFEYLTELFEGGEAAMSSYKEQVSQVGQGILDRTKILNDALDALDTELQADISRCLNSYATSGRMITEAFILKKAGQLDAVIHEVEQRGKDALKNYCHILDDISVDLMRMLMQLQQHIEHTVSTNIKKLDHHVKQDSSWLSREIEILKQFEHFFFEWASTAAKEPKFDTVLLPNEIRHLKELFDLKHHNKSSDWLNAFETVPLVRIMQQRLKEKLVRLDELESKTIADFAARLEAIQAKYSQREVDIFHERMREIVDLVEQNKAEAYLLRKRISYRLGRHEEEDLHIQPAVKNIMKRRHKTATMSMAGSGRPRKVEFENDEPLPDYVVMKDFKEIVDQISKVPVDERERLFEMRVVEVDDIADFVDVKDELDKEEFNKNMRTHAAAVQSNSDISNY